jgi:GalNAc-alpha-(1->4)-GalNAc-alpha-(1->3)-diNAcBac-PP-undecaprenol alpha-1,4-N-acetyl-D-galactosaminyltransferase
MNSAILVPSLGAGGAERIACTISQALQLPVITWDGENPRWTPWGDVINLALPPKRSFLEKILRQRERAVALLNFLESKKIDRVSAFMESASIPLLMAARMSGRRIQTIVSIHSAPTSIHWIQRLQIRSWFRHADGIIVHTAAGARTLSQEWGLPSAKIRVVPNPLAGRFLEPVNSWSNRDPGLIVGIGRLDKRKGFDRLIKAFSLLPRPHKLRLAILGEGPDRKHLEGMISTNKMADCITMPGNQPDVRKWLELARLFVLSSPSEAFPGALAEAMGSGCPVVSFDCPTGPGEMIKNRSSGILVPNGDSQALSLAMEEMLRNEDLAVKCAKAARIKAEEWSVERIAPMWLQC